MLCILSVLKHLQRFVPSLKYMHLLEMFTSKQNRASSYPSMLSHVCLHPEVNVRAVGGSQASWDETALLSSPSCRSFEQTQELASDSRNTRINTSKNNYPVLRASTTRPSASSNTSLREHSDPQLLLSDS